MSISSTFNQFIRGFQKKPATASLAKERLQIIVSHERLRRNNGADYLELFHKEILDVILKYFPVRKEQVNVDIERTENNATLALNITLPDSTIER